MWYILIIEKERRILPAPKSRTSLGKSGTRENI